MSGSCTRRQAPPDALSGLTLEVKPGGTTVRRALLDVQPGGPWDTAWLRETVPASLTARVVTQDGSVGWHCTLNAPAPAAQPVIIPRSDGVRVEELHPLMLRGANDYPRRFHWPGIWRGMTEGVEAAAADGVFVPGSTTGAHSTSSRTGWASATRPSEKFVPTAA